MIDINPHQLQGHFDCVWAQDDSDGNNDASRFQIVGIIYEHPTRNRLCLRNSQLRHHISDIRRPNPAPPGLRTLKLFLDIYFDDFGIFRNVYNAAGGVYLTLGNMPQELRQKLRNIFDLGLIPAGVSFEEYIKPFVFELEQLERGCRWRIGEEDVWVVAGM